MKHVLIIEDDQTDYEKAKKIIENYGIKVVPSNDEFRVFSQKLTTYAHSKSEESLKAIAEIISQYTFDFVLLDIHLKGKKKEHDRSGDEINEKILQINYKDIGVCYLTNAKKDANADNFIEKSDHIRWETNIYKYVIKKLIDLEEMQTNKSNVSIKTKGNLDEVKKTKEEEEKEEETRKERLKYLEKLTSLPKGIENFSNKERFKISPTISIIVDFVVKYLFYGLLILLFLYASVSITISVFHYWDRPILIAEQAFLVFLPFLISCGFFVFYMKSLSPYIMQKQIDKDDFEDSSNLMMLSKKLFVSSLLSILFIKLIELLLLSDDKKYEIPPFSEEYGIPDSPLALLYFVIGFILILILYYIYIDRNHSK